MSRNASVRIRGKEFEVADMQFGRANILFLYVREAIDQKKLRNLIVRAKANYEYYSETGTMPFILIKEMENVDTSR